MPVTLRPSEPLAALRASAARVVAVEAAARRAQRAAWSPGWGWARSPGAATPARTSARGLLETFCEAGGTLIDTAAAYGAGDAERLVGRLVDEVAHRDDVVIASKAGFVVRRGERVVDTSRRALLRDLDASLRGSAPTTSTCGRCTPGATRRWRSRSARSTRR